MNMPKHKRKHKEQHESNSFQEVANLDPAALEVSEKEAKVSVSTQPLPSLAEIRANALTGDANMREDVLELRIETAHTISELEAWRDEIDRTIAFLKARR
jgi:hypothetical protein